MTSEAPFFTKKIYITLPGTLNNSPAWHYFTLLKEALWKKVILAVSLVLGASFIQGIGLLLLLPLLQLISFWRHVSQKSEQIEKELKKIHEFRFRANSTSVHHTLVV
jgi:hypothetical protein